MHKLSKDERLTKIGFFDSGIGGFSLLRHLIDSEEASTCFYLADDAFAPYGNKTSREIIDRSIHLTKELAEKEIDLLVIACNTATAHAIDHLRDFFSFPIVGVEPYLNVLNHIEFDKNEKIAVLMTRQMKNSARYQVLKEKFDPQGLITEVTPVHLATLVEQRWKGLDDASFSQGLIREIGSLRDQFQHLILGCTHYPLISEDIERVTGAKTIDPSRRIVARIVDQCQAHGLMLTGPKPAPYHYFKRTSDDEWGQTSFNELIKRPD